MDYAGVDLMPSAHGAPVQVIEVNGVAAWQGLQRVSRFNIARAIVADLFERKLAAHRSRTPRMSAARPPEGARTAARSAKVA